MDHRGVGVLGVCMVACQPVSPSAGEAPAPTPVLVPAPIDPVVEPPRVACEADMADPVLLFGERLVARLPVGVEVVEVAPERARTTGEAVSACGAVVRQVVIGVVAHDPDRSAEALRDAIFKEIHGLGPGAIEWRTAVGSRRPYEYEASYAIAAVPGLVRGPIRGWFAIRERPPRQAAWALYEAHPEEYPTLEQSFRESGKRLLATADALP